MTTRETERFEDAINNAAVEVVNCRRLLELADTWFNGHTSEAGPEVDSMWL
jgi:hypothetical protein